MAQVTPQYPILQRRNQGVVLVEQRNEQGDKELMRIPQVQFMPVQNAPTAMAELTGVMNEATGAGLDMNPFVVKADQVTPQTFLEHNVVRIPNYIPQPVREAVYQAVNPPNQLDAETPRNSTIRILTESGIKPQIEQWIEQMGYTYAMKRRYDIESYPVSSLNKDRVINDANVRSFFFIPIGNVRPLSLQNKTNKVTIRLNNMEGDLFFISSQALRYYVLKTGANSRDKRGTYRLIWPIITKREETTVAPTPIIPVQPTPPPPVMVGIVPPVGRIQPLPVLGNQPAPPVPTVNFGQQEELNEQQLDMIERYFALMSLGDNPTNDVLRQDLRNQLLRQGIDIQ